MAEFYRPIVAQVQNTVGDIKLAGWVVANSENPGDDVIHIGEIALKIAVVKYPNGLAS